MQNNLSIQRRLYENMFMKFEFVIPKSSSKGLGSIVEPSIFKLIL